jgi:hypothetical protein
MQFSKATVLELFSHGLKNMKMTIFPDQHSRRI